MYLNINPKDGYVIFLLFLDTLIAISASEIEQLHYFETLHQSDIVHHVTKRSLFSTTCSYERKISLRTLGKHFKMKLKPQTGLLCRNLRVIKKSKGMDTTIPISDEDFLQGYLEDNIASKVHAYFEHGNLVATIKTKDEVYTIEPAHRHLKASDKRPDMIAYRASDVKKMAEADPTSQLGTSFCGFVHPDGDEAAYDESKNKNIGNKGIRTSDKPRRTKRQTSTQDTCSVALVADYRFYQNVGNGDDATVAKYLIGVITRVNDLYRQTDFGEGYSGLGFEIKEIIIHDAPTEVASGQTHYNMQRDTWATKDLLKAFSLNSAWGDFCLAHLFTNLAFSDGVLGLGWIASSSTSDAGGICSRASGGYYYNTAWTSSLNKYGNRLLTQEADLVTSHEFGHNWGSQHDPDTDSCSPPTSEGGKFLMYTYSVTGYDGNNDIFSPCSKRGILSVLQNKASSCFTERSTSFCGNYRVEETEECDAGAKGKAGNDPCCDAECKLKSGAACSDANSECCNNCKFANTSVICRNVGDLTTSCEANSYCGGTGPDCPPVTFKPDNTPCIDNGTCQSGKCLSFCENMGLKSCACDTVDISCKTCCAPAEGGACTPYTTSTGAYIDLSDGKPCVQGYCEAGTCKKEIRQLSDRVWDVIKDLDINYILRFMKDNIVITVIVISLVIYVPLCLIIYCIDKRRDDDDDKEVEWRNRENTQTIRPGDESRIRQTYTKRRKRKQDRQPLLEDDLPPLPMPRSAPSSVTPSVKSERSLRGVKVVPM